MIAPALERGVSMDDRIAELSPVAREQVDRASKSVRDNYRKEYGASLVESVRRDALENVLSLCAPRMRAACEAAGGVLEATGADGTLYRAVMGTDRRSTGETFPELEVASVDGDAGERRLMTALFFDHETPEPWSRGSGRVDRQTDILAALDAFRPLLAPWDGWSTPGGGFIAKHSAEREMVRLDGGFAGATCRAHLEALRRGSSAGAMERIAFFVPNVVRNQVEAGYVWGERFLAYDDTDKRACAVAVPGASAAFHENVDLIDDHASWFVAVETDADGSATRVSVVGFDRFRDDPVEAAARLAEAGWGGLAPHVSYDLRTGALTVAEGFDESALVSSVLYGAERDDEAFADLDGTFEGVGVEARTDFECFGRDYDPDAEAPAP